MDTTVLVLIIVVVVLLAVAAALAVVLARRRRSEQLREQFGPEYEARVSETGDRRAAEADLQERRSKRSAIDVRPLDADEHERFQHEWESIQREFVDDPPRALNDAERLVVEVMRVRGYPADDVTRRTDDLSVDHPTIVRHYREAHAVQEGSAEGSSDTERQRLALTSYRSLVEELLQPHGENGAGNSRDESSSDLNGKHRTSAKETNR